jgi:hypothetical protein
MQAILEYLDVDIANGTEAAMRGVIFIIFLAALIYCICDASEITAGGFWRHVGLAYGVVAACIGLMAWIHRRAGEPIWTKRERKGFDVILKK